RLSIQFESPSGRRRRAGQWQARVSGEIERGQRHTVTSKVVWTGADDLRQIDDLAGDQGRIAEASDTDADVDILGDQVYDPVRDKELDAHTRIPLQKCRQGRSDMVAYEDRRGVNTQVSARYRASRSELGFGGFDGRQDVTRPF